MTNTFTSWAKDTLYLALCWLSALWMPLYFPSDTEQSKVAILVYSVLILLLLLSERRAVEKGKQTRSVALTGIAPLMLGYSLTVFIFLWGQK